MWESIGKERVRVGETLETGGGGGLYDGESSKRGAEKRNKRGKNGTKGQLFITLRVAAGGPVINWCVCRSDAAHTHTHAHKATNKPLKTKHDYCVVQDLLCVCC